MLEGLEKIDWKKLQSENIPIWLRQLASPDTRIRSEARTQLGEQVLREDNSNLQGIDQSGELELVLSSGIHLTIIPFLVELLTIETVEDKERLLEALHFMAEYTDYFDESHNLFEKVKAIREGVWEHHTTYFECLNHESVAVKLGAVHLIAEYAEHKGEILPRLIEFITMPLASDTKAEAIWEISHNLLRDKKINADLLAKFREALEKFTGLDQDYVVRVTATVSLVNVLGKDTPLEIVAHLVETLTNAAKWSSLASTVLALVIPVQARTLTKLGVEKGIPAAVQVMDETQSVESCFHAFVAALLLAFCSDSLPDEYGIIPSYSRFQLEHFTVTLPDSYEVLTVHQLLNSSQEAVIEAAVRNDCVWSVTSNVFDILGIPSQREEVKSLLA